MEKYSEKSLYAKFKPDELCFTIAVKADHIDNDSYVTDDLKEARAEVAEGEHIFICTKRKIVDCLNVNLLYEDLIDHMECEGVAGDYLAGFLDKEEFNHIIMRFLRNYVNDDWFVEAVVGVLDDQD